MSTRSRCPRRHQSHWRKDVADSRVLCTVLSPTSDEPFRHCSIKWTLMEPRRGPHHFVRQRDYVLLDLTDIRTCDNGERIAVRILHSLDIDLSTSTEFPALLSTTSCRGGVERFMQTRFDPMGSASKKLALDTVVQHALVVARSMETRQHAATSNEAVGSEDYICLLCCASTNKLTDRLRLRKRATCAICYHSVCPRCYVEKDLVTIDPATGTRA
ncbi:TPA: hypothetical protein N0F65_000263 [Lagenidium giganteum]|uniref:Uncharacterized protein n=1 Tax=Lagenidium giganteum TaxID=4803 RepID=A0AAV2Z6Q6_9STRA|nr:TPA: hypothetical protein N0F65_000263 [Lagenidium giganteum]